MPERSERAPRIYTRTGDDGTTGLLFGGRARKDSAVIEANGDIDEAQAAIGLARAATDNPQLDAVLVELERGLYVTMAEVATAPANRAKLEPGRSLVTADMVAELEHRIDDLLTRFAMPAEFVVPGGDPVAAALDHARTVVRRAERRVLGVELDGSSVPVYLNRLSDLLWALARWQEGQSLLSRDVSSP
ncbi:MAG TPA: cob(I)yrinic acid a,c-diamide adenosyltransferase [Acidimicrobiales bacterium]|nr:cob(I)yrinic acid a,c-diamide adenosyltransferase [Acidimicrobiales bacterium]